MAAALTSIGVAVALIRIGWEGRRRLGPLGWAVAAPALAAMTWRDGAWGLAVGTAAGMAVALGMVLYAGWISPAGSKRAPREAGDLIALPRQLPDVARRIAVFVLTVPCAFAAAQWLAFGAQALARKNGAMEANTVVLTLFLQPILWIATISVQMTRASVWRMIAPPALVAVLGTILWGAS